MKVASVPAEDGYAVLVSRGSSLGKECGGTGSSDATTAVVRVCQCCCSLKRPPWFMLRRSLGHGEQGSRLHCGRCSVLCCDDDNG